MSHVVHGASSLVRRRDAVVDLRSAAASALGFCAVASVGFSDGGYYEGTWRWATVALTAVVGIALLVGRRPVLGRLEWTALGSLGSLGTLMAMSASWAVAGAEGLREAERCALYVVAIAAFLVVLRPSRAPALLAGVVAGATVLALYALGQRIADPPPLDPYQGSLLKDPVGYANALGIVLGIGIVLALGFFAETRGWPQRVVLAAVLCTLGTGLVLTSSRGAWLATVAGATVLVVLRAGLARRRWVLVAIVVFGAVAMLSVAGRVSFGDRPDYWRAAITDASDHPMLGSGAGTFDDYWLGHRPIPAYVRDAHSLYLETAAELGPVGLVLLLCALGAPLIAARHAENRAFIATAVGGYVAFLVHAGLDWDWEMPVTTIAGLACGAALLAGARRSRPDRQRAWAATLRSSSSASARAFSTANPSQSLLK